VQRTGAARAKLRNQAPESLARSYDLGDVVVCGVKRSFFVGLPRLGSTSAVLCMRTIAVALLLGRSPVLVLRARDVKSASAPPTFSLQILIQTSAVPETFTLPMHHAPRTELQLEN